jgi:hypothetical protein
MDSGTEMKYVALDWDLKQRRLRVGSCVIWTIAIIVLAWTGHIPVLIAATVVKSLKWW